MWWSSQRVHTRQNCWEGSEYGSVGVALGSRHETIEQRLGARTQFRDGASKGSRRAPSFAFNIGYAKIFVVSVLPSGADCGQIFVDLGRAEHLFLVCTSLLRLAACTPFTILFFALQIVGHQAMRPQCTALPTAHAHTDNTASSVRKYLPHHAGQLAVAVELHTHAWHV